MPPVYIKDARWKTLTLGLPLSCASYRAFFEGSPCLQSDRLVLRGGIEEGPGQLCGDADSRYSAFQRMAAVMRVRPLG